MIIVAMGTLLQRLSNHIRFLLTVPTAYDHKALCDSLENESVITKANKLDSLHKFLSLKKLKKFTLHIQANAEMPNSAENVVSPPTKQQLAEAYKHCKCPVVKWKSDRRKFT